MKQDNRPLEKQNDKNLSFRRSSDSAPDMKLIQEMMNNQTRGQLKDYETKRLAYENSGISILQAQLLKALSQQLIMIYPELSKIQLIKNIGIINNQLMMREFDILMWACLNNKEDVLNTINPNDSVSNNIRQIMNRILMTGFFCKLSLSDNETKKAIEAFFSQNFPQFIGKNTEWLLLNEPDLKQIDGIVLNIKLKELKNTIEKMTAQVDYDDEQDFNKLVEMLGEEHKEYYLKKHQQEEQSKQQKSRKRSSENKNGEEQYPLKRQKVDTPSKDELDPVHQKSFNASFYDILQSKIYDQNEVRNLTILNHTNQGEEGRAQDLFSITSGIYDMKELLKYAIGTNNNEQEPQMVETRNESKNINKYDELHDQDSMFGLRTSSELPAWSRIGQSSLNFLQMMPSIEQQGSIPSFRIPNSFQLNNGTPNKK